MQLFKRTPRSRALTMGALATVAAIVLAPLASTSAMAASTFTYDFNTAGDLTSLFDSYVSSGSVGQSAAGGISGSGAINAPGEANAVFATKAKFGIGPIGSVYNFSAYIQSVGNAGYSGVGFTALTPSSTNARKVTAYRPIDALGISLHGGGFIFENGSTDTPGTWADSADHNGIHVVKSAWSTLLNDGSPTDWYKIIFSATRTSETGFDTRVEIWPSDAAGVVSQSAAAIFEMAGVQAPGLLGTSDISSFINFSGNRAHYFDNYGVTVANDPIANDPIAQTEAPALAKTGMSSGAIAGLLTAAAALLVAGFAGTSMVRRSRTR